MATLASVIPYLTALVYFFGQLMRVDFFGSNFPLLDVFIIILALTNVIILTFKNKQKIKNKFLFAFCVWSAISLCLNFLKSGFSFSPLLYLLRLLSLFSFLIFEPNATLFTKKFKNFFLVLIITNIIFGLIQYFLWPDFTYFKAFGWDPHLYRLVGTFFDPTFTALIYLFFLITIFGNQDLPPKLKYYLVAISYIALALTYSRSTYISLFAASLFASLKLKNIKLPLFTLLLIISTILLLPRQPGEGTKLERTSSIFAKIENYKQGIALFVKSPIIGTGYNRLSLVRTDIESGSHAIGGFDGSLLTILVTTGLPGLILFTASLVSLFTTSGLIFQSLLVALLAHSLFANSLLYPWILLFLVFVRKTISRT